MIVQIWMWDALGIIIGVDADQANRQESCGAWTVCMMRWGDKGGSEYGRWPYLVAALLEQCAFSRDERAERLR